MSHTVGFRRSGESRATDRGEMPGSMLSASLARLAAFIGGVRGVIGMLRSSGRGTRLTVVRLIFSVGDGAGVNSDGGGVIRWVRGMVREMAPTETGEGDEEAPRFDGIERRFGGAGVSADLQSEGSGDSSSPGRLS